jgi:serine protease
MPLLKWGLAALLGICPMGWAQGKTPALLQPANAVAEAAAAGAKVQVTMGPLSAQRFYVDLPSNVSQLTVRTAGSGGDVDIFVRPGVPHSSGSFQGLVDESTASSTAAGSNEQVLIGRADGLTPGRWWITLGNFANESATVELSTDVATNGASFAANIGQSGTWYDPAKNLQGLFIQYFSAAQAIVVWFTFTPEGEQAWFLGVGEVSGDSIRIDELSRTRGGRFGAAFDPAQVVYEDIGDLRITFDTCGTGYASFLPQQAGWPHEQLRLEQLTGVAGLSCTPGKAQNHVGAGMSGSWFDASRSGEGWLVQVLNQDLVVAYWFTYDADGRQVWVGGVGELVNGSFVVSEVIQPVGGRFGPGYAADQVNLLPWGAMGMTFTGCDTAAMQAFGGQGFGAYGAGQWQRLTPIAGTPVCDLRATPAQLAATIQAAPFAAQDGDVNDPATPAVGNDTPASSQALGNPAAVAGFLAAAGTGRQGDRFQAHGDPVDAYQVTLTAGQSVQLLISDWQAAAPTAVDFDLRLYRVGDASAPVQSSLSTGRNEFISVAETGRYDVVVNALSGFGNYTLAVTSAPTPSGAAMLRLEDDLLPGQIIIRFDEPFDDGSGAVALYKSVAQRQQEIGLPLLRGQPGRSQLYALPGGAKRGPALAKLGVDPAATDALARHGWGLSPAQQAAMQQLLAIKALRARPDVLAAEANQRVYTLAVPSDQGYPLQWHLPMINLPQAWDLGLGQSSVWVSVIDTGVNPHPDLAANVLYAEGADLIADTVNAIDGDGRDRDARDPGDGAVPGEDSFHGTHVAGIVAALQGNGGISGVAPGVRIMPVRVLGARGGSLQDIADGMLWSAGLPVSGARASRAADVMNLSLGGVGECPSVYQEAITQARQQGVIVIAAAGNDNSAVGVRPADCAGVVKVAAVGPDYLPSNFSNCRDIDVAAPGGEVVDDERYAQAPEPFNRPPVCKGSLGSSSRGELDGVVSLNSSRDDPTFEGYKGVNGTSQAAPHVAGVAALMKSLHAGLTPAEFDALLANGQLSFDPRAAGVAVPAAVANEYAKFYGAGIIDAFAAARVARERAGGAPPAAAIVAQPAALDFGELATSQALNVTKVGSGAAAVTAVSEDAPWLTVAGGGPDGLGQYTLSVSRSGLAEADYAARLRLATSAGTTLEVPVSMRVGARQSSGKAGEVYALIIDALTLQPFAQQVASLASGSGRVSFASLYPGAYYVVYGTDLDNDGVICDAGEFCGFLPYGEISEPLQVNGQNVDIGFAPLFPDLAGIGSSAASSKRAGSLVEAAQRIE